MTSDKTRNLLASIVAAVVGVGFVVIRSTFDLGPVVSWSVMAFLTALLWWRLKNRSPYSDRKDHLK